MKGIVFDDFILIIDQSVDQIDPFDSLLSFWALNLKTLEWHPVSLDESRSIRGNLNFSLCKHFIYEYQFLQSGEYVLSTSEVKSKQEKEKTKCYKPLSQMLKSDRLTFNPKSLNNFYIC